MLPGGAQVSPQAQNFQLLLERETPRAQHAQKQMPGRWPVRAVQACEASVAVQKWHGEPGLKMQPVESADGLKKLDGRVVTAHEKVLAVVHNCAGGRVTKRARAPAEIRLLLQQTNPFACLGHRHTRREARKTATDDENVV